MRFSLLESTCRISSLGVPAPVLCFQPRVEVISKCVVDDKLESIRFYVIHQASRRVSEESSAGCYNERHLVIDLCTYRPLDGAPDCFGNRHLCVPQAWQNVVRPHSTRLLLSVVSPRCRERWGKLWAEVGAPIAIHYHRFTLSQDCGPQEAFVL